MNTRKEINHFPCFHRLLVIRQDRFKDLNFFAANSIRVSHKHTTLAIMPILASKALLCENKKFSDKMLPPVGIEPGPLMNL